MLSQKQLATVSLSNRTSPLCTVTVVSLCAFNMLDLRQFCTLMCSVLQMYRSQHLDGLKQAVTLIIIYATSLRKKHQRPLLRSKSMISFHTFIVFDSDNNNVQANCWAVPVWINGKWSPSCLQVRPLLITELNMCTKKEGKCSRTSGWKEVVASSK